jgi:hypothetical protein
MTAHQTLPAGINIGHLRRSGLMLYPKEVVAVVHALCDQEAGIPTPDELWITVGGQVIVRDGGGAARAAPSLTSMGLLIDTLLPPFSEDRHHAPPASLHMLPARLRGTAASPIVSAQELLDAIRHYETDVPARVLQQLVARAAAAAPGEAPDGEANDPVSSDQAATAPTAPVIVAVAGGGDWRDQFTSEQGHARDDALDQCASEQIATTAHGATGAGCLPHARVPVTPQTLATATPRSRTVVMLAALGVGFSLSASGYGGYWVVRHFGANDGQTTVDLARQVPPPLADHPIDPVDPGTPIHSSDAAVTSRSGPPADPESSPPPSGGRSQESIVAGHRDQNDPVRAPASRALMLPVMDGAFSPSFAATGAAVVFHAGRRRASRLLEADLDDQGAPFQIVTVLEDHAHNYHPRVSPDERLLAFDSDRDGERGVYVADRDGTNVRRVSGPGFAALPSWSPDMQWLAFVRAEPGRPHVWNLWLRDLGSGALTRLTSYRVGQTWAASWFPDAHRLCYSHEDQLVLLDLATGATDVFPSPRAGRLVRTPAVSPEGRRVIFQVFREGVWMVDLETRAMRKILDDPTAEEFAWHPLGNRVAYHSHTDGEWRIWVTAPPS